jgi:uncharacterized protein (TIGR03083 family)
VDLEILHDLTKATLAVVRGVKPEQLGARTPCAGWDVRTLANHLLQVMTALRMTGTSEPIPDDFWGRDLMTPDWMHNFEREADQALSLPAHENAMATMLAVDLVLHGWDLARATGQEFVVTDAAAALTFEFVAASAEQGRAMGIYGEPVPVDDDAPVLERALGLSGRDPQWHPRS